MDSTTKAVVIATIVGAVIGAAGAILGGFLGAWFIANRDDRRRRLEHKAAVRAILHELAGNLATFAPSTKQGSARHLAVSQSAYDGLLVALFSADLPERVATHLGQAYGRLTLIEKLQTPAGISCRRHSPTASVPTESSCTTQRQSSG